MNDNLKKLTTIEKAKLVKFAQLSYSDKEKLKLNNHIRYNNLILLQERFNESKIVISHQKYRQASSTYNHKITASINPSIFITIKYVDSIAKTPERVIAIFSDIKEYLKRDSKDYQFQHHIEKGADSNSYHSHLFVSSLKNKQKQKQIEYFINELENYRKLNKISIANGYDSIDVRIFDKKELNLPTATRVNYVGKQDTRQYFSLDISSNTDIKYAN